MKSPDGLQSRVSLLEYSLNKDLNIDQLILTVMTVV
jgi:hypothetical protein